MLVRPITMKPARRNRATTGRIGFRRRRILQRARAGAGHLPLDVEQILDRDRNAGKARRRGLGLAQPVHRFRRLDRGFLVDMNEDALALARRDRRSGRGTRRPVCGRWCGRFRDHRPVRQVSACSAWLAGLARLVGSLFVARSSLNVEIEQRRAQRLAVRVQRQRPRHAAAERAGPSRNSAPTMLGSS